MNRVSFGWLALAVVWSACGVDAGGDVELDRCGESPACGASERCIAGRCEPRVEGPSRELPVDRDADVPRLVAVRLEPSEVDLVARDGERPTVDFEVVGILDDGAETSVVGPSFAIDMRAMGTIDVASGAFEASGRVGGVAKVHGTVHVGDAAFEAEATITLRIERTTRAEGVSEDVATRFASPVMDDTRAAGIAYPLEGVVMPQNVYPADVQWLKREEGDLFRVTLEKPHVRVDAYVAGDHWLVDEAAWRAIAETDPAEIATLTVDRWEVATSTAIAGAPIHMRFARTAIAGSVYYWDIERGRIVRIDDGTATRNEFMPNPAQGCVGCHSVSPSGRFMAGRLGGGENTGTVYDLTRDLTANPPDSVFPVDQLNWWFSSWSPDETRLVVSQREAAPEHRLAIYDPMAGVQVAVAGEMPTFATHPAWAPDGTQIAYVTGIGSAWGGANTAGDIALLDVIGTDAVGESHVVHLGAAIDEGAGTADSYPTWSPDSTHIAFAHGTGSRSESERSSLYWMKRDGSGVVRLANASPGDVDFQPRFSPFQGDGYYFLSFLSRRDYGNETRGTRGAARQQIWVTAVRMDGEGDPSAAPYWVPGQNTASRNISAYWAPRPCRSDGDACGSSSECCGGDCRPGEFGAPVCSPPPADRCRALNETCSTDADCCGDLACFGNVCLGALL